MLNDEKKIRSRWKWLLLFFVLIASVAIVFYFFVRIYRVNSGYVAVKVNVDGAIESDYSVEKGYVVYVPLFSEIEVYPTTVFNYDLKNIQVFTRDGFSLQFSPNLALHLDAKFAGNYYKYFKNIQPSENRHLEQIVKNIIVNEASLFDLDSLIRSKVNFENILLKKLSEELSQYALVVKNLNSNLEYPSDIKKDIDLKLKIRQDILIAEAESELAYIEANTKRKKDSLEYSNLSKLSIQKLFIEKWDGRLAPNPDQPIMYREINNNDGVVSASGGQEDINYNMSRPRIESSTPRSNKSKTLVSQDTII